MKFILGACMACCVGGVVWLLYDMDKQLKAYREALYKQAAEEESTLGLVEDEEEDKE
jgi:hypothetical protein